MRERSTVQMWKLLEQILERKVEEGPVSHGHLRPPSGLPPGLNVPLQLPGDLQGRFQLTCANSPQS